MVSIAERRKYFSLFPYSDAVSYTIREKTNIPLCFSFVILVSGWSKLRACFRTHVNPSNISCTVLDYRRPDGQVRGHHRGESLKKALNNL